MSFHTWEIFFQTYEAIAGRKDENVSITWVTALRYFAEGRIGERQKPGNFVLD